MPESKEVEWRLKPNGCAGQLALHSRIPTAARTPRWLRRFANILTKIRIEDRHRATKKERQKRSSDHRNLLSRSKLRFSRLPAAACVLFVQHSPEKAERHR
jgi:hypothetical protein